MCISFSAWYLPRHCAVHCSLRRGEWNIQNSRWKVSNHSDYDYRLFLSWINAEFFPETLHNTPTANVFDPLTPACLPFLPPMQLHVSQSLGTRATGEDPGQAPRSGEGLLQQRAMSVQPPHPNTAITQLQGLPSCLCQPSSFSVPKLSLCLLISTIQDGYVRTPHPPQ